MLTALKFYNYPVNQHFSETLQTQSSSWNLSPKEYLLPDFQSNADFSYEKEPSIQ